MRIEKIQPQNFEGKQRFLSADGTMKVQKLLKKMNNETVYNATGDTFESKVLGRININNEAGFTDKRFLVAKSDELFGESTLNFDKTELVIDNTSGEIKEHRKPFFKSWKKVLSKAEELISTAIDNFDNNDVVRKRFIKIGGFTRKGAEKLKQAAKNTEKKPPQKPDVFLETLHIY